MSIYWHKSKNINISNASIYKITIFNLLIIPEKFSWFRLIFNNMISGI